MIRWKKFSRDEDFNEHYIIKLDFYEPWSFKRRRKYLETCDSVLRVLRVLGGEGSDDDKKLIVKADETTRK
ncbi:unnamed protein product [Rhizophagus irregularis]|nr:unnamed protein product [Rhizophagus irregularis]